MFHIADPQATHEFFYPGYIVSIYIYIMEKLIRRTGIFLCNYLLVNYCQLDSTLEHHQEKKFSLRKILKRIFVKELIHHKRRDEKSTS